MSPLALAALAIGPGMFLVHVAWVRDRHREPLGNVLGYFLLGALAVVPAGWLEARVEWPLLGAVPETASAPRLLLWTFLGVALIEEGLKYAVARGLGMRDRHLDEPFDWIVYAVAAALGFATAENAYYVFSYGESTGWVRAFTAVPAHALDGTLMGTRLASAARLAGGAAWRQRVLAVLEPALWHTAYDFPLFLSTHEVHAEHATLHTCLWIGVVLTQWVVCAARVQRWSRDQRGRTPPILAPIELARTLRGRRDA